MLGPGVVAIDRLADLETFDQRAAVAPEYDTEAQPLDTLSLTESFRSTAPVLEFVDAAIDAVDARRFADAPLGTLSGGGKEIIKLGERCLLGANSGLGIPLGDDCVLEAGLYLTAGTKVTGPDGTQVKARDLAGQSNLLFRRNSVTGAVEVVPWRSEGVELNAALHKN